MKKFWLVLLAAALLCGGCVRRRAEDASEFVGVGRMPKPVASQNDDPPVIDPHTPETLPDTDEPPRPPETEAPPAPVTPTETEAPPVSVTPPAEETQAPPDTQTPPQPAVTNTDTLSPFGAIPWYLLNGHYVYDIPAKNTAGMATMGEMYTWPVTFWEDKNKDNNDWYPGKVIYDEWSGTVNYVWDRYQSTLDVLAKYGAIYRGDTSRKVIYLTFDCGYEYGSTGKILDELKTRNVPATFFLTGPYVRTEHDLIARMLDEGHVVGNHTNKHLIMVDLTVDEVIDEMQQVEESFRAEFPDAPDMMFFRPPQGAANEWLLRIEAKLGYRTVFWSFAYGDWSKYEQPDPEYALETMKAGLHPGCVYLLHAESSTNAQVIGTFIDWVFSQGYAIEPLCGIAP